MPAGRPRTAGFAAPTSGVGDYLGRRWDAIKSGELGSLPIIFGLIVIVLIFGTLEDQFLTARNFTNLLLQMAPIAALAMGIVFILLIADGEVVTIDLSVAYVAAVGGVVMTLLQRPDDPGWPWWACILGALVVTTAIGLLHALIITKLGVPSFITTLAGFLVWSGVVLILTTQFSTAGTIRIQDDRLVEIANNFLSDGVGWAIAAIVIVAYAGTQLNAMRARKARGLDAKPIEIVIAQIVFLSLVIVIATYVANTDRGVPQITITLGVFLLFWTFVTTRTTLRPPHLRGRWQSRGDASCGHQCRQHPHRRLRDQRLHGRRRWRHPRVPSAFRGHEHRWRQPAAQRDRSGRDRRHQPVRWLGSCRIGAVRGARHHVDHERHGPARSQLGYEVHRHGPGAARCRSRRLDLQATAGSPRPHLRCASVYPVIAGGPIDLADRVVSMIACAAIVAAGCPANPNRWR